MLLKTFSEDSNHTIALSFTLNVPCVESVTVLIMWSIQRALDKRVGDRNRESIEAREPGHPCDMTATKAKNRSPKVLNLI